jgi:GntR family transcriptional regulator
MQAIDASSEGPSAPEEALSTSLPFRPLDKTSFIPLAAQMLAQLEGMIRAGKLEVGQPMPSEESLAGIYGVSRPAVRQTLELLRNRGYVVRRKGRGTFVSRPRVVKKLGEVASFSEEIEALGLVPGARVVSAVRRPAGADTALQLGIFRGTPVFHLQRVRTADGVPIAAEDSCVELARFAGIEQIDFTDRSLYRLLREQYGVRLMRMEAAVEAHAASRAEARLLEVAPRTCLLRVQRTVWGADGRPVETTESLYRGDRYRVVVPSPAGQAK